MSAKTRTPPPVAAAAPAPRRPDVDFDRLPQPFFGRHTAWSDLAAFAWRRAAAHVDCC